MGVVRKRRRQSVENEDEDEFGEYAAEANSQPVLFQEIDKPRRAVRRMIIVTKAASHALVNRKLPEGSAADLEAETQTLIRDLKNLEGVLSRRHCFEE
jgi:hypothetical protein